MEGSDPGENDRIPAEDAAGVDAFVGQQGWCGGETDFTQVEISRLQLDPMQTPPYSFKR